MPTTHSRRYDAVICDIDGCLGPERASEPLNTVAMARIAEHNHLAESRGDRPVVTLCTGRPQPYAEAICRSIANTTLPIVCEMGVWLWWPTDNRYDRDPALTESDLHAVHEASEWIEHTFGPRGVVQQPGKTGSISLYHPDTAYLKSLDPQLRDEFARRNWPFRVSATWLWVNIEPAKVSKATGIERLIAATGLTKDRLAGIGDTVGDKAIRDHVAFFACPANAQPELKQHADYISPHHEIEGVLDILSQLNTHT